MPTFSAIAFDRLIEPGASNSIVPPRYPSRRLSTPNTSQDGEIDFPGSKLERVAASAHNTKFDNRTNISSTKTTDKKHQWSQISPALYATPESTPLPDSPSSFPPSPYIINHKRRGPRLIKSFCEEDVATWKHDADEIKTDGVGNMDEIGVEDSVSKDDSFISVELCMRDEGKHLNGACSHDKNCPDGQNDDMKSINTQEDDEVDDIVDPQDSVSVKSENEDAGGAEISLNLTTPLAEFYDAWEELSSENGPGPQLQVPDIQSELSEMRLSLLMEIEKRKQAEETLHDMRNQWQRIREKLSHVGLTLPEDPTALPGGEQPNDNAAESLCQQVYLARFVSNSIGRGIAKAEAEMEMEARIKTKNIEIARLWDRLHYYEAVNQEMSQRNQQVVETSRRLRQQRERRQKWVWGSIAAAATLGSTVLAYSYFYSGKSSPSSTQIRPSDTPKVE